MGIFIAGSLIQTIILINDEDYAFPAYQGALLAIAVVVVCYVVNAYASKALPYWQNAFFLLHVLAYFAYIVPIWVNAPTATHSQVWGEFQNDGGWPSMSLAVLVGQVTGISEQVGIDTVSLAARIYQHILTKTRQIAHMAEEVQNASRVLPRAMISVYILNFALLFPAILTVCYHMPDLQAGLDDSTTYPAIYVMRQAMSTRWISVLLAVIAVIAFVSAINYFAAVTRDLFAFARDHGMPFSEWLGTIDSRKNLPIHAGQLSTVIAALLSLIYIGSPVAFYAITSLCTVSLVGCYTMSISSVLWRRIYLPHTLPPSQFSLGRWGVACNLCAVIFGTWSFFWSFWPQTSAVTASSLNWASPIFCSVLVFSVCHYYWKARHVYLGPVRKVEGRT